MRRMLLTLLTFTYASGAWAFQPNLGADQLRDRFRAAWRDLDGRNADEVFDEVAKLYGQPGRAYHTLDHVADCVSKLESHAQGDLAANASRSRAVIAFVFHDAVYDLTPNNQTNNEAASAALFRARADRFDPRAVDEIDRLIMATRSHVGATDLERLFVDIDLSILAGNEDEFAAFERGIRREYAWVSEPEYRRGRAAIMRKFLDRRPLYQTPVLRDAWEDRAKRNLEGLLRQLR